MIKNMKKGGSVSDKYVIAIGASAGGLEAIHEFFDHMPLNESFAFIVIQHLSSEHKSLLVELVSKHTHMKVYEAQNNITIQQNCVYIIPNDKLMTISQGRLKLAEKAAIKAPNTAIDHFLYTLANDKKEKAVAIILSGTGSDGTKGIQAIKECGGLVIVQDPASAKFDGMPNSAIASGHVDFIVPPAQMSKELLNYANEQPIQVLENGNVDEQLLDEIFQMVHEKSGNSFELYKTPTIIRRIGRRMNENGISGLRDYIDFMRKTPGEVSILGQDFLIGVTRFFRDEEAFDALSDQLSKILETKKEVDSLKIWVCACSTGQEAFTVAMIANECVARSKKTIDIKIFATDIDEKSIEIAAKNQYPYTVKNEIPEHLFNKYMMQDGQYYGVKPRLRKQIVFAKHDVTKSPPFIKNDLVTCRNMLIYISSILQEKILSIFHFSLVQGGVLLLGSSETASSLKGGMTEISGKWKIYQKTGPLNYANYNTYNTGSRTHNELKKKNTFPESQLSQMNMAFNNFMTSSMGYIGLFVDRSFLIREAIGDYRRYLSLPEGKMELNILKMVSRSVSISLGNAIRDAWKTEQVIHLKRLKFEGHSGETFLNISIKPPKAGDTMENTLIVLIENVIEAGNEKDHFTGHHNLDASYNEYVSELEAELAETRHNLQQAIEEMETTNEELQSTNEELLSANEELQSSNEELQSLNEELHTLNTEHQLKIRELFELNDDLNNYFRSTDIGQVFVDSEMYIRKFNAAATAMVNLIEADIGRSIEQITNNIAVDNLNADIRQVMQNGKVIEKDVRLKNGQHSFVKIMPYLRMDRKTDGVVITFVDISKLTELSNILNGVFNASLNGVMAFKAIRNKQEVIEDFTCIAMNEVAGSLFAKSKSELLNASLNSSIPELTEENLLKRYIGVVDTGQPLQYELKLKEKAWFQLVVVKMGDGIAITLTDISRQKLSEEKIRKNYNELLQARESLKALNAELEGKVKERTKSLLESESRFNLVSRATKDKIWDWDLAENTMWRSDNFNTMFGYEQSPEHNNIAFYFNSIHPEDRERVKKGVYAAINDGQSNWTDQYRLLKNDGTYATILDRGSLLLDENQIPYRMVGSILDISLLVDTENRLSSTEKKFRKIFDSNMIGMIFSNVETGQIEDANQVFLNMLGYSNQELLSGQINWEKLTPEEFLPISRTSADLTKTEGFCPPFEKQYIGKSGKVIDVLIGSALLDEENRSAAVTYVIDITKQKIDEKRRNQLQKLVKKQQDEFYSIFKKAPALISIRRGKKLQYDFVNEAYMAFDGQHDYQGQTVHASSQFSDPVLVEIEKQVLASGKPYTVRAFPLEGKNDEGMGKESWFDLIINPVFSEEGTIDGISFFAFEVSDLVKAQQTTKELMQKKDEFLSIASHELKTPLTSIKGFLQFTTKMAMQKKFDNILTFVDKANKQAEKLGSLVDDLLDVTRIQAGKMIFTNSRFQVSEIIKDALDSMQGSLAGQQVITQIEDIAVFGDKNRLEQVITNFLSNGLKYAPDGKVLTISTKMKDDQVRVSVRDQGIGIPAEKVKHIFERFFRVEESNNFSGLGLGLYISSEIIKRHGGEIGVDTKEGQGSEFWFEIPVNSANI
jgi:two-component system CheB/CheR fusion protein